MTTVMRARVTSVAGKNIKTGMTVRVTERAADQNNRDEGNSDKKGRREKKK